MVFTNIFFFCFQVLQVRAVDGDRGLNTPVTYSIVDGPAGDIFAISPDSGTVYTQTAIDRESQLSTNGAVILTIRAQEIGGPSEPFVDTEVTIMIEVRQFFFYSFKTFLGEI